MTLPAGYQQHPTAPGYMWNPETNDVQPILPAAPAAPPTPSPTPAAAPAAAPAAGYGSLDVGAAAIEHDALQARAQGQFDKKLIIEFPDLGASVNSESVLCVRFLPPWGAGQRYAWAKTARFRLDADLLPSPPEKRKVVYIDSWDAPGGPGNCPISKALLEMENSGIDDAQKAAKRFKARQRVYWQALDLMDPQKHYQQKKDQMGNPELDPNGQPIWQIVPGVVPMGNQLHRSVLSFIKEKGDCTHPDHGYGMKLKKVRTGRGDMDVEYSAMDMDKGPIDPSMRTVLGNLMDLQTEMLWFRDAEEMNAIANNLRARYLGGVARGRGAAVPAAPTPPEAPSSPALPPGWQVHPNSPTHAWNPSTNAIEEIAKLTAPPVPAAPPAPPPVPAAPPVPPAAPPMTSAGPPLPPAAPPGIPPAPPPAPPAGGPPAAPTPPPAPGMPAGAMSPGQLEQQLAHPGAPPQAPAGPPPPAPPAPPPAPVPPGWDPTTGTPF